MPPKVRIRVAELRAKKESKENRHIRIEDIAEETGLSYSTVQRWLTDKPTALHKDVIMTFAKYFSVSAGELIEITNEDDKDPHYKTTLAYAS